MTLISLIPLVHIDPDGIPDQHMAGVAHTLPFGVTAWQVYTNYLAKLHGAAIARLQSRRGVDLFTRLRAQDRVQYILTIPAAWQSMYRNPIIRSTSRH